MDKEFEVSSEWLEQLIIQNSKNMTRVLMYSELASNNMLWFKLTLSLKNDVTEKKSYIVKFPPLRIERVLYKDDYYPDWSAYDLARDKILTLCRRIVGWDNVLVADRLNG
jgi:hypothetical protein